MQPEAEMKLRPQNPASEKIALGAILIPGERSQDTFDQFEEEHFFDYRNLTIFRAMALARRKTIHAGRDEFEAEMRTAKTWEDNRTGAYFTEAVAAALDAADFADHIEKVHEKAMARRALRLLDEIRSYIVESVMPVRDVIAHFENDIFKIAESKSKTHSLVTLHDAQKQILDEIDNQDLSSEKPPIPTGFLELDQKLLDGWKTGDVIVCGARPGVGKSSLALSFALNAAKTGTPALFFALEMRASALARRAFSMESGVPLRHIQPGRTIDTGTIKKLLETHDRKTAAPLYFDDSARQTVESIAAISRRAVARHGVGFIAIDYLQLIDHGRGKEQQYLKIGNTTRELKILARQLGVPILYLSQLNRECENREGGRPLKSDLRDSGNIEQDADTILLLWPQDAEEDDDHQRVIVCIDKQRNGPQGEVTLNYSRPHTRFENRTPDAHW